MKYFFFTLIYLAMINTLTIFDFDKDASLLGWQIVDDTVMGGRSAGNFSLSPEGHGVFEGKISLDNYGGFSSVRYRFPRLDVSDASTVILTIKGDGKRYQFRVKDRANNYFSYITTFATSGEWEEIRLPLSSLYPSFRGRTLDFPNFADDHIEEVVFLIGNKTPERFKLMIDKIEVE